MTQRKNPIDEAAEAKRFIWFSVPHDPEWLAAYGALAIRHVHVEYMLKMMIKNFTGVSVKAARISTSKEFKASWKLRKRVLEAARISHLPVEHIATLEALIETCRILTEKRNEIIHALIGEELDAGHVMASDTSAFGPLPSVADLNQWSSRLEALRIEMLSFCTSVIWPHIGRDR